MADGGSKLFTPVYARAEFFICPPCPMTGDITPALAVFFDLSGYIPAD